MIEVDPHTHLAEEGPQVQSADTVVRARVRVLLIQAVMLVRLILGFDLRPVSKSLFLPRKGIEKYCLELGKG